MQSGTIVFRKAGTMIPNAYLERVIKANPTGWGAAVVSEVEGKKFLELTSESLGMDVKLMQETLKAFMEQDITFYLCSSEGGVSLKDISPYVLLVKKSEDDPDGEDPIVVGFIEGNFPGSAQKDSSHPPEYHLAVDYLIPKLESMWEMADGDLDKVTEQLKKPYFRKEMVLTSVSRGTITLVCANGEVLTYAQNDLSAEYPWGWVSNTHGYVEGSSDKKPDEKKKSLFPSRSTVREAAPSSAIAAQVASPKTETAIVKKWDIKADRPPGHLSRSERKDWYKSKIGYCPPGWEKSIAVNVYVDPTNNVMTFSQMNKALGLEAAGLIKQANNPPRGKDTETDHISHDDKVAITSSGGQVTAEILPIMSPKTREVMKDHIRSDRVKKVIAENADVINDPKIIEGYEMKFADFPKQLGMVDASEFLAMPYEEMLNVGLKGLEGLKGLANMCFYFRNKAVKAGAWKTEEKKPEEKKSMFPKRSTA